MIEWAAYLEDNPYIPRHAALPLAASLRAAAAHLKAAAVDAAPSGMSDSDYLPELDYLQVLENCRKSLSLTLTNEIYVNAVLALKARVESLEREAPLPRPGGEW